ncbi:MAG: ECF transporter S component [Johnsonella sp.]|nr:ECF transporter S component [Johnsonella sp.]
MTKDKNKQIYKLSITALMAALCYAAFTFLKIPIPTPAGYTALHLGNAFCVLAALLMGGVYGGLAGSLGMTIADLMDPVYISSAPKTFVLKLCIGLITGYIAHRIAHIRRKEHKKAYVLKWSLISAAAGLGFNVIMDPIVGYLFKRYFLGVHADAAKIMAAWAAGASLVNAFAGVILSVSVYAALRPILEKSGLAEYLS